MTPRKERKNPKERRQYPRVPTEILLDVRSPSPGSSDAGGVVVNLSLGGLAFESKVRFNPGMDIYIALEKPLALMGRIIHAFPNGDGFRYGVRFTSLELFSERKMERYVSLVLKKT